MSVIAPTQQELKILEGLREHRRKHRQRYPHQTKLHADNPAELTLGQKVSEKTGLERTHLYRKLKALGIDVGNFKGD